jgi:hypothetical protein
LLPFTNALSGGFVAGYCTGGAKQMARAEKGKGERGKGGKGERGHYLER